MIKEIQKKKKKKQKCIKNDKGFSAEEAKRIVIIRKNEGAAS